MLGEWQPPPDFLEIPVIIIHEGHDTGGSPPIFTRKLLKGGASTLHSEFLGAWPTLHFYFTQSVFEVVLQKSIPTQIRQLILHISYSKVEVVGFVGELTSAKRLEKHFV